MVFLDPSIYLAKDFDVLMKSVMPPEETVWQSFTRLVICQGAKLWALKFNSSLCFLICKIFIYYFYWVRVWRMACTHAMAPVRTSEISFRGVVSLLPSLCGLQEANSGGQAHRAPRFLRFHLLSSQVVINSTLFYISDTFTYLTRALGPSIYVMTATRDDWLLPLLN